MKKKNANLSKKEYIKEIAVRRKGLLPGLLTTGSLFISFYGIVSAIDGNYINCAISIIIAAFLDAFDGRVARLTKSSSTFGEHYDSLADVIAFGATPAVLFYCRGMELGSNIAISISFIYMSCCCVRLARFSTNTDEGTKDFNGMPSPTAGGFIAATIWLLELYTIEHILSLYISGVIVCISGLLMVSNLPFISGRRFIIFTNYKVSFNTVLAIFYFGLLIAKPAEVLFLSGCLYITISIVSKLKIKGVANKKINTTSSKPKS